VSITITDYNPEWPAQFRQLRDTLIAALGDLAITIEHVGSTSVPGLAAKPVIDIDVVIQSLNCLPAVVKRMSSIGYAHQGDLGIAGRHAFKSPPDGPARHVYVCDAGAAPLREHLAFRDYLRQHPDDARAYAALKRGLAGAHGDVRAAYTDRKTAFVHSVLSHCLERHTESPEKDEEN
jgi:GrpB-like predicted nucleotidyltransferase (UPF0157 family)